MLSKRDMRLSMVGLALVAALLGAPAYLLVNSANADGSTNAGAIVVNQGQTYFVSGENVIFADSLTNNGGNVFVMGQLYVMGDVSNSGVIVITNGSRLEVNGVLTNTNSGTIRTDSGSLLEINDKADNQGTIDNFGYISGIAMNLTNNADLNNYGRIQSMGLTLTNNARMNNAGAFQGSDYSFLINNANLVNSGSIINGAGNVVNNGVLNNTGLIDIHTQTYGVAVLENHAQATINNSANILIEGGSNFANSGTLSGNPATVQQQAEPKPVEQEPQAPADGCNPGEECVIPG